MACGRGVRGAGAQGKSGFQRKGFLQRQTLRDILWMVAKSRNRTTGIRNPGVLMIPLELPTNNGFKHAFQVVQDFVHPQYGPTGEFPRFPFVTHYSGDWKH